MLTGLVARSVSDRMPNRLIEGIRAFKGLSGRVFAIMFAMKVFEGASERFDGRLLEANVLLRRSSQTLSHDVRGLFYVLDCL